MADFEIRIKTTAEGSGAQKTAADLKDLTAAAKPVKPALEELTKESDKTTVAKGKLSLAVNKLAHEFPALGIVASTIRHPLIGLAAVIVLLVQAWRKYIDVFQDVKGAVGAHESIGKILFGMSTAAGSAAQELASFNVALADSATKGKDAADELGRVIAAIQKLDEMQAEKRSAQEGLELAGVNAAEREGTITKGDAIRQRAAIKDKFADQAEQARIQRMEDEQEARKDSLRKAAEQRAAAEAALPGALAEATEAERRAGGAPERERIDLESITKERADIEKQLAKLYERRRSKRTPEVDAEINKLTDRRLRLVQMEGEIKTDRTNTEAAAKEARTRAEGFRKDAQRGRDTEGKLFDDIITGGQAIESFRRHRGVIGPAEKKARGLDTESEAGRADREEEERRQREAERDQRESERRARDFFKGAAVGPAASVQGVVSAVNDNGAAVLAAMSSIEAALRANTRSIETAHARIQSTANRMA